MPYTPPISHQKNSSKSSNRATTIIHLNMSHLNYRSLLALCVGGLEELVRDDLLDHLPLDAASTIDIIPPSTAATNKGELIQGRQVHRGEASCGKLVITPSPQTSILPTQWLQIRSVQYWMVHLHHSRSLPVDKDAAWTFLKDIITNIDFSIALQSWLDYVSPGYCPQKQELLSQTRKLSFCARCIRDGNHPYGSMEVAKFVGEQVFLQTNWDVSLSNMDLEIVVLIINEQITIGMSLPSENKAFTKSKLPSEIRKPVLNSSAGPGLRPSTAYLMGKLARPQKGDFLLDGLCGSGSVAVESSLAFDCLAFGGDADKQLQNLLVEGKKVLREFTTGKAVVETMLWSAHRLPVLTGSMDCVVMDLPFSKLAANIPKHYRPKPPAFIEEVARVCRRSTGRVVLLVQSHQQVISCLDSIYFHDTKVFPVNISGYIACIITTNRTDVEFKPIVRQRRGQEETEDTTQPAAALGKRPYSFVDSL